MRSSVKLVCIVYSVLLLGGCPNADPGQISSVGPVAVIRAPSIVAAPDKSGRVALELDGSGSYDPTGAAAIARFEWWEASVLLAEGVTPTVELEWGIHDLRLAVTDSAGIEGTAIATIKILPPNLCGALSGYASDADMMDLAGLVPVWSSPAPALAVTYFNGLDVDLGLAASPFPSEAGWQGQEIRLFFTPSAADLAADRLLLSIDVSHVFTGKPITMRVSAGVDAAEALCDVRTTSVSARRITTAIPNAVFAEDQPSTITVRFDGVAVGYGAPAGIQWRNWALYRDNSL